VLDQLGDVQLALRDEELAGWLLVSAGGTNPVAERLLAIDGDACSRRWFYWIPADGIPVLIAHRAEVSRFPTLPGELIPFSSWPDLRDGLGRTLPNRGTIAMEYSPMGVDAELGRVDAGTLELVRSYGPRVVSSESLARRVAARWSDEEIESHLEAADALDALLDASFSWLDEAIASGRPPTERRLIERITELAESSGVELAQPARVASGQNSADPTHRPTDVTDKPVSRGDVVQITLVGALPNGSAAEVGDVAYVGDDTPKKIAEAHALVVGAIEAALDLLRERAIAGRRVLGFEIDRAVRDVLARASIGEGAVHRAGHGLMADGRVAPGTQLDGLEMHDVRPVEPGYVFSLHPGVYTEAWGIRVTTCFHIGREGNLEVTPAPKMGPRRLAGKKSD